MESELLLDWLYADMDELIDMVSPLVKKEKTTDDGKRFFEIDNGVEGQFCNNT